MTKKQIDTEVVNTSVLAAKNRGNLIVCGEWPENPISPQEIIDDILIYYSKADNDCQRTKAAKLVELRNELSRQNINTIDELIIRIGL